MYKVLVDKDGRLAGMSIFGFQNVQSDNQVVEMDGEMPDLDGAIFDYIFTNGKIKHDPLPEEPVPEIRDRPTNEEIMEAVIELADNFAELKKGVDKWLNFLQLQSTTGK